MLCNRGLTTSVNAASRTAAASHLRTKLQAASVHRMGGRLLFQGKSICETAANSWSKTLWGGKHNRFLSLELMSSFDPISIFRDITLGDLQSPCGNLPHLNWKIRFEPSLVLRCIFFHPNIYNPSCWVVSAVRSGISAVRSSSLHMPLTTKRARELFLLPFQSCERCPGKSSHISPWVQMVARPKYALQRHTDILKKKNIEKEETAL